MEQRNALRALRECQFLRLAAVVGCCAAIHPMLGGAFVVFAIVRWVNLRDDPRFAKLPDPISPDE